MTAVPYLIYFRDREEPVEAETAFTRTLSERFSLPVVSMPFLYDLRSFGGSVRRLREMKGPLIVISRLPERAVRNLFLKLQIPAVPLGFIDLELEKSTENALEKIKKHLEGYDRANLPEAAEIQRVEEPTTKRWYPIIDETACIGCLECVNFCLFGVYTIIEGDRPCVDQPDACRAGCPACSRVCPGGAIMFPLYSDATISGRMSADESLKLRQPESAEEIRRRHIQDESETDALDLLVDETDRQF